MATKKPVSRGVNQAAAKSLTTRGVNQAAAKSLTTKAPPKPAMPAAKPPAAAPAPRSKPKATTRPKAMPAPAKATTAKPGAPPATTSASAASIDQEARNKYGYMAWALDDPELGKVLRQAAAEGWDESRLKGGIFATNWFKTHGTAKVAATIKAQADSYLVPMDDQSRRNFAFKLITGELQGAEMASYLKEQAKSMFPQLAGAIDRGVTVADYASPYRALAAQTLELPAESINLTEPRWRRALDGKRDDKGMPAPMSLSEWESTIKSDSTYGFDYTKQARTEASQLASKLQETFGAR